MTDLPTYVASLDRRYQSGIAREHSYRGDLQNLLQALAPGTLVTNEPARVACGAPDYILTNENTSVDVGYIEAKDIGRSLDDKAYREQFDRYRASLPNLIITDYLTFKLYREGEFATEVSVAEIRNGRIRPKANNFNQFRSFIGEFVSYSSQSITTASGLASKMAAKAKLLAQVIEAVLDSPRKTEEDTSLLEQMNAFRSILIHDIDAKGFSDIYAQTIAYGMFSARLHDASSETFTRQEAAQLIPQTNPFLRKLFQYISGYDIDPRIEWIVDALAEVFQATNIKKVLKDFGKAGQRFDPMIHFYETFLTQYDPDLRRNRGVWYTPEPVVRFIVSALDDVLKCDFSLSEGLADTRKIKIKVDTQEINPRTKKPWVEEREVHKVQILDPATGTGTFLAEVVKRINNRFSRQKGLWSSYVEDHLIPRLNGFELLMASYAVAHLKLDLLLQQTGYRQRKPQRLHIYLTNSLEEHHPDTGTLFASWLSKEANEANHIKRDTPVMVVLGNPPYSRHSMNKGHWLSQLLESYKREPCTNTRLRERNSKWLNDDYVKFIRHAQHFIDKSGYGVFGFITNHGFIDNPTFRGMRWSLLRSFNKLYIIDLHGNSNVSEAVPHSTANENVFDIKQGVAITIAVRTGAIAPNTLAEVYHKDVYGSREEKYTYLDEHALSEIKFDKVKLSKPFYLLKNRKYNFADGYRRWPALNEIFKTYSTGYYTSCDDIVIGRTPSQVRNQIENSNIGVTFDAGLVRRTAFRPFDFRYVYYDADILTRARAKFVNSLSDENTFLLTGKSTKNAEPDHFYLSDVISELKCAESSKGSYMFPLWLEQKTKSDSFLPPESNIEDKILRAFRKVAGNAVTPDTFCTYIYSIMYSGAFRTLFSDQLREDFIRVPPPTDRKSFISLSKLGNKLRDLHTLTIDTIDELITEFPNDGSNQVTRLIGKNDWEINSKTNLVTVWINDEQCFTDIPFEAWELSVGGYFPAQKWLKDRRNSELSVDEILDYQKIIAALNSTVTIMSDIDEALRPLFDQIEAQGG
ncbi:hypothetical protein JK203_15380 [Gluconobacter cerinus]|uniref:type ISP restriction/modification enzyme n=1 Tax=Gluconobacter cerinus TaxID=38307 RepID=UPI001B8B3B55|nr:type ISP restriction/modification enzyme [Gluconobacter cerinus]MBS1042201.1 hypothetical protein [Gluconobacter cerinus]MBS1048748.1 hypothetical protein [Gluconobacter cerinus]